MKIPIPIGKVANILCGAKQRTTVSRSLRFHVSGIVTQIEWLFVKRSEKYRSRLKGPPDEIPALIPRLAGEQSKPVNIYESTFVNKL